MPLVAAIPAFLGTAAGAASVVGGAALIGSSLISANSANKASSNALSAQNTATDKSIAAQQAALQQITALQQPFINAGQSALPGLQSRVNAGAPNFSAPSYALPQPGGTPTPAANGLMDKATPVSDGSLGTGVKTGGVIDPASAGPTSVGNPATAAPPNAGGTTTAAPPNAGATPQPAAGSTQATGPDWNAYLSANPDVAARAQQGVASGEIGGANSQWATPQEWAAFQYQNTGQSEGRQLPMLAPTAPSAGATQAPATPQDLGTASPVVANYTRPDQGTAPDASQFINPANFTTSPGYQFRLDQGLRNTNASFGAKGLLQSGAALQGFNDYAQNSASSEYQNWFNQQQQLYQDASTRYNTGLNNANNNFADDRSYGTNLAVNNRDFANSQYNTQTQNMFQLAGIGTQAAGAISGANSTYASNASNLYQAQGNNTANAANAQGATNSQLASSIGGTVANLFSAPARVGTSSGSQASPSYAYPTTSSLAGSW